MSEDIPSLFRRAVATTSTPTDASTIEKIKQQYSRLQTLSWNYEHAQKTIPDIVDSKVSLARAIEKGLQGDGEGLVKSNQVALNLQTMVESGYDALHREVETCVEEIEQLISEYSGPVHLEIVIKPSDKDFLIYCVEPVDSVANLWLLNRMHDTIPMGVGFEWSRQEYWHSNGDHKDSYSMKPLIREVFSDSVDADLIDLHLAAPRGSTPQALELVQSPTKSPKPILGGNPFIHDESAYVFTICDLSTNESRYIRDLAHSNGMGADYAVHTGRFSYLTDSEGDDLRLGVRYHRGTGPYQSRLLMDEDRLAHFVSMLASKEQEGIITFNLSEAKNSRHSK